MRNPGSGGPLPDGPAGRIAPGVRGIGVPTGGRHTEPGGRHAEPYRAIRHHLKHYDSVAMSTTPYWHTVVTER